MLETPPLMQSSTYARSAGEAVRRRMEAFALSTGLTSPRKDIFQLSWEDIVLMELLGQGSFSSVYKVVLRNNCGSRSNVDACGDVYALKCLHHKTTTVESCFMTAAVDLAMEAKLLANLLHPNLITLWGVKSGCVSESYQHDHGYFLLLDFLVDTLEDRLELYRDNRRSKFSFAKLFRSKNASKRREMNLFLDRLENIALGIASGMEYLHQNRILFRDLKPQNIGFDVNGVVRIFDFGLAREIEQGTSFRVMTGQAGTPRYMAPENFTRRGGKKGGFPSDVYSFTILLWEILTLGRPFGHIKSILQLNEEVVRGNSRPPLEEKGMMFSTAFKSLLKAGWDWNPENRPSFTIVRESIQKEASELSNYLSSFADKQKRGLIRRNSWSAEKNRIEETKTLSSTESIEPYDKFNKESPPSFETLKPAGSSGTSNQATLTSLVERTRMSMAETLHSESRRAEDDIKRLKSILKVGASKSKPRTSDMILDLDSSERLGSVTSVSTAPARLKARKLKSRHVQPQEAVPEWHNTLDEREDSSTGAITSHRKTARRNNRTSAKPVANFGLTAVSSLQASAGARKTSNFSSKRASSAESYHSTNSAKSARSARSRASAASRKKKGPGVVLDTVQSVQHLQSLLHHESDDNIDANDGKTNEVKEMISIVPCEDSN